jgi:phospholipid transport system substrate-binding protein
MLNKFILVLGLLATTLPAAAVPVPPDQAVRQTTEKMQDLIRKNHAEYSRDQPGFYKVVDEVLTQRFDVRYIAQLILGKNWRAADDDQRNRFAEAFKLMLIRSYANTLLENYDSVKAEWQPLRLPANATDATVRTTLLRDSGPPVALAFAMRLAGDEWKIYDITVESISLVTNFRSQVTSEIKRTSIDAVITRMETGGTIKPASAESKGS